MYLARFDGFPQGVTRFHSARSDVGIMEGGARQDPTLHHPCGPTRLARLNLVPMWGVRGRVTTGTAPFTTLVLTRLHAASPILV